MSLLRTFATVLARTIARAASTARGSAASPRVDVVDGYEAWLAESFPGVQ